ncbi:general secretion pathway protein GspE [Novimethylophilus kurashikiensis]|uniref:General secretion pathway protein GspE n=1 Tax=Novimethylophilus kurashikiensis TaxID=1825523 RepID=A0A2R5F4B7_9PROT|nr:GspE/PulE family protein [Novimethylophilus kurashikiensis]GBG13280.1 general secretion pathway protein GspE [Novimethylophilus kurashikiensis]
MSTAAPQQDPTLAEMGTKLAFTKKLQAVTNKIHATRHIDEIILEVSEDIRTLFEAERITLYVVSEDKTAIVSKVKTGLNAFKELRLPINPQSIAGYVAHQKTMLNIADVYDDAELAKISPDIRFLKEVDKKTGFRTKQMLAFPILSMEDASLMGVVQVINTLNGLPFPETAEEGALEIGKTLAIALNQRKVPLGQIIKTKYDHLIAEGVLAGPEMELAKRSARSKSKDLEDVLIEEFQVKPADIGKALSSFFGVPYEAAKQDRIKPMDLLRNLKQEYVQSSGWIPIDDNKDEGLVILTPDPERVRGSRVVSNIFPKHAKVTYKVCLNRDFIQTLGQFYGMGAISGSIDDLLSTLGEDEDEGGMIQEDISAAQDNELVKLVNKIIIDAYNQGASDIHIEPYPEKGKTEVRFRRDGTLINYIEIPPGYRNALAARIKIMCDLDIAEKRKPQDGKIKFKKFGPLDIELRVATIPTAGGLEDIVMRILAAGKPIPLDKLGLSARNNAKLKELVAKPYGLFFVCGPTGSGKTTTLHSALGYINTPETKIWTAEDPVEITQKGLRQVQVNKKAGLDFATVMKAFLRADPDVIMVGEMRDQETVSTGIEASLTGHLVFATLHTNSAPESIVRLLDMGMDPFNFADALLGILAQRLAKRLCDCKEAYTPDANEIKAMLTEYCVELKNTSAWKQDPDAAYKAIYQEWVKTYGNDKGQLTLYRAKGCDKCGNSGYKGRVGLHELLEGTDAIKKNIQEHARVAEMFATALEDGMRTLKQDGIEKVLQGVTDMKQVRTVCIK